LHELATGEIDIVIGTHRLISGDVQFKDLGLVVIDEEQRFGVTHKEHLKKLRTEVDVLTLTATPIPRTLYMALTGVRDISNLNTPPEERLPIVTHVGPYSPKLVRQAILREIERGGQVFFVHNRVQTIDAIKAHLNQLVPEARCGCGSRSDARGAAGVGDAPLQRRRYGHPAFHDHHRIGTGHPEREHAYRGPRRHLRPGSTLSIARPGRTRGCARLLLLFPSQ
jgi:hypothetical protein